MADIRAETIYMASALVCAVTGACFDYRSQRIPNWLTASSTVAAVLLHGLLGGWREMGVAVLAGLAAGGAFLLFYVVGGMGGGDVKLIAAVGACAGLSHLAAILITTALAGGAIAMLLAVATGRLPQTLANVFKLLAHHGTSGLQPHPDLNLANAQSPRLPYGVAIATGTVMAASAVWLGY